MTPVPPITPGAGESPPVPPEVIAQQVQPVAQAIAQHFLQFQFRPPEDPVLRNVTPEIINQAIAAQMKKDEHEFELKKREGDRQLDEKKLDCTGDLHTKLFAGGVIFCVLALVLILTGMLLSYNKPEYVEKIVTLLIGLAGGFGLRGMFLSKKSSGEK
jgi:hypothetical protein